MSLIIRPLTIFVEKQEPIGPTIHHYPLITAGNEYGMAGIARATTAEEDETIKTVLMNRSL